MSPAQQFLESSVYTTPGLRGCHSYILPRVFSLYPNLGPQTRVLDVGCGNGSVATEFAKRGCSVVGIDLAESGIRVARESCPKGKFEALPADVDVLENLGERPFDLVYSLEVIEHLYDPRSFLAGCFAATRSGGRFICSTPYHGYLKNLMISAVDGWDKHADPLFDGGHIKLFSRNTFSTLIEEAGFRNLEFRGAGRYPYLWKSMVISGTRP
jgi:cyclopropane fatty-acyl-phospholipid synthase-like methyltransferase